MITEFLISNGNILNTGPFTVTEDRVSCADGIYPTSVIGEWKILKQDMPNNFNITDYEYKEGSVVLKLKNPPFDREAWKLERAAKVAAIVVEVDGMTFDGDEVSQGRMVRAILALRSATVATTGWVLSDNSIAEVTVEQLSAALVAAGRMQTAIWVREE